MQARVEPLPVCKLLAPSGLFLITEDELSVAPYVSQALQHRGVRTAMIATSALGSPEELARVVAQQRQIHGRVTGIVHLAPLATIPMPESLADWRYYTQIQSKSLFHLLQLCASDLQQAGQQQQGWVLAASFFGGYFGRSNCLGFGLPTSGSANGLLKTLITEWSGVYAKAIDFDNTLSPSDMAQHIINELLLPGGRIEVGYPQGQRTIFQTVPAPLETTTSPQLTPSADWVVLITGGARGITAEIVSEIVSPGMTLVVVGRSPEPDEESPTTAGITGIGTLRRVLVEQARSQGLSPTPMQIERQLLKLMRDRAIYRNLQHFKQAGGKVEYLPVDVKNEEEFGSLINGIYKRHGRLDVAIHGAGIIEDKLIADKTLASFDRVFDTKVDSTFILSRYLRPESLKALVLFSSVAGRYGNRGQSDYAAANEAINRFAWFLDEQWSTTRIVSINWGPWDTVGMASQDVKRQFRERGIVPIPLAAGRQFFIDELRYGRKGEAKVIAGEGPWEAYEAEKGQLRMGDAGRETPVESDRLESPISKAKRFVLLSSQPQVQPNSTVTLEHTFSLSSDPYLDDHRLDGKPVLPAAGALEWMAEFVQSAWPEWTVTEVRDLRVLRGLVLESHSPVTVHSDSQLNHFPSSTQSIEKLSKTVLFKARASSHADAQSLQVAAEILDLERNIPFYRASIILRPVLDESPTLPLVSLSSGSSLDTTTAYRDYLFHGERFQLVKSIDRLNEQGIDAWVMPSQTARWVGETYSNTTPTWLFDPGLVDTAPQLAIAWDRVQRGSTALPSRFGAVIRYGQSPLIGPIQLALRVKSTSEHSLVYDAVFLDQTGEVRLHLMDVESTSNPALNRLANQ